MKLEELVYLYLLCAWQEFVVQSIDGTHILALPVSKHMVRFWGGVPIPMVP